MNENKPNFDLNTIKRLFGYIKKNNRIRLAVVAITIIINTISTVAGSLYLTVLIDNYIEPLIGTANPEYSTLIHPILVMIAIYLVRYCNNIYLHKSSSKYIRRNPETNS